MSGAIFLYFTHDNIQFPVFTTIGRAIICYALGCYFTSVGLNLHERLYWLRSSHILISSTDHILPHSIRFPFYNSLVFVLQFCCRMASSYSYHLFMFSMKWAQRGNKTRKTAWQLGLTAIFHSVGVHVLLNSTYYELGLEIRSSIVRPSI